MYVYIYVCLYICVYRRERGIHVHTKPTFTTSEVTRVQWDQLRCVTQLWAWHLHTPVISHDLTNDKMGIRGGV